MTSRYWQLYLIHATHWKLIFVWQTGILRAFFISRLNINSFLASIYSYWFNRFLIPSTRHTLWSRVSFELWERNTLCTLILLRQRSRMLSLSHVENSVFDHKGTIIFVQPQRMIRHDHFLHITTLWEETSIILLSNMTRFFKNWDTRYRFSWCKYSHEKIDLWRTLRKGLKRSSFVT